MKQLLQTANTEYPYNSMELNMNVPTNIEIASQDLEYTIDFDYNSDDENSIEGDFDHQLHYDDNGKYDVSRQDLDALKRMVREMRANPELLHKSPVYSNAVVSMSNSYQISPFCTYDASIAPPSPVSTMATSSRTRFVSPMEGSQVYLCQECNSDNVSSSQRPIEQFHPSTLVPQIPTLPFQVKR